MSNQSLPPDVSGIRPVPRHPGPFVGWRRPPGGAWEKVPETEAPKQAEVFSLLSRKCMLRVGEDVRTEYLVLPVGEYPRDERQKYLNRNMSTRH